MEEIATHSSCLAISAASSPERWHSSPHRLACPSLQPQVGQMLRFYETLESQARTKAPHKQPHPDFISLLRDSSRKIATRHKLVISRSSDTKVHFSVVH